MSDIHEHWRISVETFGDVIIAIESECLAGRELSEIDCATIRHAVSHLTAFLGDADQLTALQAENARLRAACEASLPLMQAVDREEVTDVADWHAAEALIRAALQQET